jgi:extracellular elastinolytic metalloproteinase
LQLFSNNFNQTIIFKMRKKLLFFSFAAWLVSWCYIAEAQSPADVARDYLSKHQTELGLSNEDLKGLKLVDSYVTDGTGVQHLYFQQTYKDIPFYNGITTIAVKEGKIVHFANRLVANAAGKANASTPSLRADAALSRAAASVNLTAKSPRQLSVEKRPNGKTGKVVYDAAGISREDIPVELYWESLEDGKKLQLVWNVRINDRNSANWWNVRVDAQTGQFVSKDNWTTFCKFDKQAGHKHTTNCKENIKSNREAHSDRVMANTYNVFDVPLESPNHGSRTVVSTPWNRIASGTGPGTTNGWHNDGSTNYTYTRGNNVIAQEDVNGNNGNGTRADGGSGLDFNFSFNFYGTPTANQNAAITNLFFWNNVVHDVLYQYGFNEVAGNFQNNNMSRGGSQGDYVLADAQDGGGLNNANFSTPTDGGNGRMQMYVWSSEVAFEVNSPSGVAGLYDALESGFSLVNQLWQTGPKTGNLVLANHIEACTANPITNGAAISGNIAVIDRGSCNFTEKVKNAQNVGAIAVVVCNNAAGPPIPMGGGPDNTITVPAVMISQSDCNTIKVAMQSNTVNITLSAVFTPDGDFDNGIVAHEYGHGWSTRLTGGPSNSSCLNNVEQMGEGWSDFLGLMLTTDWANTTQTDENEVRGIGTYAIGQPISGGGIRPFPYSYNTAVNSAANYAGVADATTFSEPHGIGSIWCTMLWDMVWEMAKVDGGTFEANIYNASNPISNVAALLLVTDGLKLQPCSPGFVDGRNAILAADQTRFGGKYQCAIWKAFARRGLGYSASQGSSSSRTDGTAAYDMPPAPAAASLAAPSNGATGIGTPVTVSWNTLTNATSYNLEIATDASFTNIVVTQTGLTTTSFNATTLSGGITYYWRVRGLRCDAQGSWSSTFSFTTISTTPDFSIAATPTTQTVCAGTSTNYTINLTAISGYSGSVSLSASGNPSGTSVAFSPSSVAPTGSSTMTVSGTAAPGTYTITVTGTDGTLTHTTNVTYTVTSASVGATSLSSPANGATGVATSPALSWAATSGAATYDLQVATDAAFTNIVSNQTGLMGTSYTASGLSTITTYYWRVRGVGTCATGAWPTAFSFATLDVPPCSDAMLNGGFESGAANWTEYSAQGEQLIGAWLDDNNAISAHTGTYHAWLGYVNNEVSLVYQTVTIPANAVSATMTYYYRVMTADYCGYDFGGVALVTSPPSTYTALTTLDLCNETGYVQGTYDLMAYAGQTINIGFYTDTDASLPSDYLIDDIVLEICVPAPPPSCVDDLNIPDNPIASDAYQANLTITSSGVVPSGNTVSFESQEITLQAGFHAEAGCDFHAFIGGCPASLGKAATQKATTMAPKKKARVAEDFDAKKMPRGLEVQVQPNPFSNTATVRYFVPSEGGASVTLMDLNGRALRTLSNGQAKAAGWHEATIESNGLAKGVYLLHVRTATESTTKKVVLVQ